MPLGMQEPPARKVPVCTSERCGQGSAHLGQRLPPSVLAAADTWITAPFVASLGAHRPAMFLRIRFDRSETQGAHDALRKPATLTTSGALTVSDSCASKRCSKSPWRYVKQPLIRHSFAAGPSGLGPAAVSSREGHGCSETLKAWPRGPRGPAAQLRWLPCPAALPCCAGCPAAKPPSRRAAKLTSC